MPRRARVHYVSLHSSLVNLPISIYGPLLERSIRPQNLAVHLTLVSNAQNERVSSKIEAYVGWTGMASASSLAHFNSSVSGEKGLETIEIDPQYAQSLGLTQGDIVDIGLLHDLSMAKSVGTEPVSSDDWEIIEIHASQVESTLLSQVRVAKIGQEINVWVLGRTRVRLRVVSLDPASKGHALLLTTNTEVSIAPKLRNSAKTASSATPTATNAISAPASTGSSPAAQPKRKTATQILRVLPAHILPPFDPPSSSYTAPEPLAYVSPHILAQLTDAPETLPLRNLPREVCAKATFRLLRPPQNPLETSAGVSTPAAPAPRVLNPGTPVAAATKEAPRDELWVSYSDAVPERHVVFPSSVEGVGEWDLVRLTMSNERAPFSELFMMPPEKSETTETTIAAPPSRRFLAGIDDILDKCTRFCMLSLGIHSSRKMVHGITGLLVTGRPGAGKTSIVRAVAKSLQESSRAYSYAHYVDMAKLSEQPVSMLKSLFRYWFDKARWHCPTILILDNMEKVLSAEVEHADSFRARHLTELFLAVFSAAARPAALNARGIILLGTAPSQAALHPRLATAHIFDEVVNVKPPKKDARKAIIAHIVEERLALAPDIQLDTESPLNYPALATQTEGYSATDLHYLVARAVHQAAIRSSSKLAEEQDDIQMTLTLEDFDAAQVDFVPLSLRDVNLQKSDVQWSDIGGLHEVRRILRETLEWPTKYAPIFAQSPLRLRSGLLLYGYPGCGKTLLASAVAKECGLNFISVKGPELLNKYIGASEKSVRDLFERANAAKPCVLFFDEFDSIAPKRGHDSTGVTDRVVNQMLTQMDGAEGLEGVYVLAATSRPDLIDSALLRPGRLDRSLFCSMPDVEERKDILRAVGSKVTFSPSVNLDEIAAVTDGFSGADLQALVYNAHLEVVHSSIPSTSKNGLGSSQEDEKPVEYTMIGGPEGKATYSKAEEMALQRRLRQIQLSTQAARTSTKELPVKHDKLQREISDIHLRTVLRTTRPSVSPEERRRLGLIYSAFVSDRSGNLPVPPESGTVGSRASLM